MANGFNYHNGPVRCELCFVTDSNRHFYSFFVGMALAHRFLLYGSTEVSRRAYTWNSSNKPVAGHALWTPLSERVVRSAWADKLQWLSLPSQLHHSGLVTCHAAWAASSEELYWEEHVWMSKQWMVPPSGNTQCRLKIIILRLRIYVFIILNEWCTRNDNPHFIYLFLQWRTFDQCK